ncbi:MAG: hypothetical protein Q4P08_00130 [Eubacteriales bacterium]|nr:hypothetical protein [Eubacteriales bacterium]
MKKNPADKKFSDNMGAGQYTLEGFLGTDQRQIAEIINEDQAKLDQLGVRAEDLAILLRRLSRAGMTGLGEAVEYRGYEISVDEWRGWLGCPFKDAKRAAKRLSSCRHLASGRELKWSDLSIHLIADHGFFQGRGAAHRIEPEELYNFLLPLIEAEAKED